MCRPGIVPALILTAAVAGCGSPETAPDLPFRNLGTDVSYTGDDACFSCHEDLWRGYQTHGMARSWYPMSADVAVESFDGPAIHHEESDLWYRPVREGDRFLQEEVRYDDDGRIVHRLARPMDYVVGSGNAARTYLAAQGDRLYELPLTWYANPGRWAFSPGYDRQNARFDRLIPERCVACHNDVPSSVPHVEGAYERMPNGIGCERCHGPGSLHVAERRAVPESPDSVDTSIVNPAHLPVDLRLDVCQQCHLNGAVAVRVDGQGPFDFRPGRPLASHVMLFAGPDAGPDGAIPVISHADRMRRSACFTGTENGPDPLQCTTCHNPHEGFRDQGPAYFDVRCAQCHPGVRDRFESSALRETHDGTASCYGCHMPRVEAHNAPHASFTDHWIRVVRDSSGAAHATETALIDLEPVLASQRDDPALERYRGMAYLVLGEQKAGVEAYQRGIEILDRLLALDPDHGEAQFLFGRALLTVGRVEDATAALERAVAIDPSVPERHYALARAYQAAGRAPEEIVDAYRAALAAQPRLDEVRLELAGYYEAAGRLDDALAEYDTVVREMPWSAPAHYGRGSTLLKLDDMAGATASLSEALHLDPDFTSAMVNLAAVRIVEGAFDDAAALLERAVRVEPTNAAALGNLGLVYAQLGRWRDARDRLQQVLLINPDDARARAALEQVRARMR